MSGPTELLQRAARERGPLEPGRYRVVVLESSLRISHQDFATLTEARRYAADAQAETDDAPPIAAVFDHRFATAGS